MKYEKLKILKSHQYEKHHFFWKDTALLEEQYKEILLAVNRKGIHRAFRIGPLKGSPIKGLEALMHMNHQKDFC